MMIRVAREDDYVAMARLRRQTIRHVNARDYPPTVIRRWSAKGNLQSFRSSADTCKRWVALAGNEIIGFCEHRSECELSRIYVHKDWLRKGIGSQLLRVAEASLEQQGCTEVRIESTITARDFYLARGYELIGLAAHEGNKQEPVYNMVKKLP